MTLATNVRNAREGKSWSQARLADEATRLAGKPISQQYIANVESGVSLRPREIKWIAAALGKDISELEYGDDANQSERLLPSDKGNVLIWDDGSDLPDDPERVWIDKYDYHFSAGNGLIQWEVREKKALPFNKAFFKAKGSRPQDCKLLVARGDSMEPYLFNRDVFMIDESQRHVKDGEIYAIFFEDEPLVKQVFKEVGGGIILHSFNAVKYPDKQIPAEKMEHVKVVGKVIYRSG